VSAEPGPLVLLVEDDVQLSTIVARHLTAHGHRVRVAPSAEAAIAALRDEWPSIVLLDINLPGDTGWAVLRDAELQAAEVPVVIVSAGTVSPRRLRETGAAGYLPKPFPLETLLAIVRREIARGQHQQSNHGAHLNG